MHLQSCLKTLLVGCLFLLTASPRVANAGFPAESELKSSLHPGMTIRQVIAQFGEPGNQIGQRSDSCLFRYIAPLGLLTNEQEGYIGFEVHFVDGRVSEWRTFRGQPSYAPMGLPRESRWTLSFWLLVLGVTFIFGTIRAFNRQLDEKQAIQNAFKNRDIPARGLPVEFRFITHDTTIQDVLDKVGPYSLIRKHEVSERFAAAHECVQGRLGSPEIVSYDYDLPYHAAVVLLPEHPFTPENRLRAVYYRPARVDDDV